MQWDGLAFGARQDRDRGALFPRLGSGPRARLLLAAVIAAPLMATSCWSDDEPTDSPSLDGGSLDGASPASQTGQSFTEGGGGSRRESDGGANRDVAADGPPREADRGDARFDTADASRDETSIGFIAVDPMPVLAITNSKVDLLFMIDNSISMADKQSLLAEAMPALVESLTNPPCVRPDSRAVVVRPSGPEVDCPPGSRRDFVPPTDIHLGIIDSSLGALGNPGLCTSATSDDHGHLLARGVDSAPANAFLSWSSGANYHDLSTAFANMVAGVGQTGCGYEAQLESVYRFLVDPDPPAQISLGPDPVTGDQAVLATGVDTILLAQRAAFLRPDSLVLTVLVSDEDDCSLQQAGQAWLQLAPAESPGYTPLRPGTSVCATNPNDRCCFNCAMSSWPEGCPNPANDPGCRSDAGDLRHFALTEDPSNLRCWQAKRRYGIDFAYPVQRYVDGLSLPLVRTHSGKAVTNPLFKDPSCVEDGTSPRLADAGVLSDGAATSDDGRPHASNDGGMAGGSDAGPFAHAEGGSQGGWEGGSQGGSGGGGSDAAAPSCPVVRDPASVLFVAVVGVPWQDLAKDPSDLGKGYKSPAELRAGNIWSTIVGDPAASPPVPPSDPLMIDSVVPRAATSTTNPLGSSALPAPMASPARANPINGHEWNTWKTYPQANADLQFACVFDLPTPRDCSSSEGSCDCADTSSRQGSAPSDLESPLCQAGDGTYTTMQVRAKAYPGLRELLVAKGLGDRGFAASICPAVTSGSRTATTFGYNPVIDLIMQGARPHFLVPPVH